MLSLFSRLEFKKVLHACSALIHARLLKVASDTMVPGQLPETKPGEEQKKLMQIVVMIPCQQTVWPIRLFQVVPA